MKRTWSLFYLAIFVGSALLLTVGDYLHMITGTLSYPESEDFRFPWGQPLWVPLLFGTAGIVIVNGRAVLFQWGLLKNSNQSPNPVQVVAPLLLTLVSYGISGYLPHPPGGMADLILLSIAMGTFLLFDRSRTGFIMGALTALGGCVAEASISRAGGFAYHPELQNLRWIPSWLPWLYFTGGVAANQLYTFAHYKFTGKDQE